MMFLLSGAHPLAGVSASERGNQKLSVIKVQPTPNSLPYLPSPDVIKVLVQRERKTSLLSLICSSTPRSYGPPKGHTEPPPIPATYTPLLQRHPSSVGGAVLTQGLGNIQWTVKPRGQSHSPDACCWRRTSFHGGTFCFFFLSLRLFIFLIWYTACPRLQRHTRCRSPSATLRRLITVTTPAGSIFLKGFDRSANCEQQLTAAIHCSPQSCDLVWVLAAERTKKKSKRMDLISQKDSLSSRV